MKNSISAMRASLVLVGSIYLATIGACSPLIATYSQAAYEQATAIKAESLALMGKAAEPYGQHSQEVEALMLQVEKAYEYAGGRPKNEISTQQWAKMKDPSKNLLGGFFKRWKEEGQLGSTFVEEAKGVIAESFDQIIGLESGKIKEADVQ